MLAPHKGVRRMAELIHPRSSREKLTVVLKAYLDDSGTHEGDRTVAVAGFIASTRLWASFENRWQRLLDKYELKRFHAAQFWARKGRPYARWSDEWHAECATDICRIFRDLNPFGIGVALDRQAFEEWRSEIEIFVDPDPYYFCLTRCLRPLIRGIAEVPNDEGVAIYIDQDKGRESLGKEIAKWHERRLRISQPENIDPNRPVSTHYVSSFNYYPVQAADIYAHGTFQWLKDYLLNGKEEPKPYFIECMKRGEVPIATNYYYEREHFNIEMKRGLNASFGDWPS